MSRTVYIDISAKLEEWTADSVVAITNGGEIIRQGLKMKTRLPHRATTGHRTAHEVGQESRSPSLSKGLLSHIVKSQAARVHSGYRVRLLRLWEDEMAKR
jgi:hypothetical protein